MPVGDAGFVLGTTIAEQLRTFAGKLFRRDDHLARLEHSLRTIGVDPGMTTGEIARVAEELVARNHRLLSPGDDLGLSIVVTPGAYPAYPSPGTPQPLVCLHTYPLPFRLWVEKYDRGQSLVTTQFEQVSPKCWPPTVKCRSRMHYFLADREAAAIDPDARALLLDQDGLVTETSTANILIFRSGQESKIGKGMDGGLSQFSFDEKGTVPFGSATGVSSPVLISPPSDKILHGISQAVAFELAAQLEIPVTQRDLTPADVATADEAFLLSTPLCLLPVTRLNGRPIGSGRPGEVFGRLLAAWNKLVGIDIVGQARRFATRE